MARHSSPRAFAPRKTYAEKMARDDLARKFGESFRNYNNLGIGQRVDLHRKFGVKETGKYLRGEVLGFYDKSFNKHYREYVKGK